MNPWCMYFILRLNTADNKTHKIYIDKSVFIRVWELDEENVLFLKCQKNLMNSWTLACGFILSMTQEYLFRRRNKIKYSVYMQNRTLKKIAMIFSLMCATAWHTCNTGHAAHVWHCEATSNQSISQSVSIFTAMCRVKNIHPHGMRHGVKSGL